MAATIIILVYVIHESSYDKQHVDGNRIVRLVQDHWGVHSPSLKYDLDELSNIVHSARVDHMYGNKMSVRYGDKLLNIKDIIFTDPELFSILKHEFVAGIPEEALKEPFSMVLTESTARKVFGDKDPIGEVLRIDNKHLFTVTAIVKDIRHSHLSYNAMGIYEDLPAINNQPGFLQLTGNWNYNYYLKLTEGVDHEQVEQVINKHLTGRQHWKNGRVPSYQLQPIDGVYFDRSIKHEMGIEHGNRMMVRVFMGIALIILLLAIINFINITTANATNRAKETGVRKVVGSSKFALITQYLSEAILVSFMAMIIALFLVELSMPVLQHLLQKSLVINLFDPRILLYLFGGAFCCGLLAGVVPAWMLSTFRPVEVLKGFTDRTGGKGRLRGALTVFQFVISTALISTVIFAYQQVKFINNKPLGINIDNIVYARISPDIRNSKQVFKDQLLKHPGILEVGYTNAIPGRVTWQEMFEINGESRQYTFMVTTAEFLKMIGLEVAEGRNFTTSLADESGKIIINRAAVDYFGWEPALGHTEQAPYRGALTVIGITENFHFNDVTKPVSPLVIYLWDENSYQVCLKLDSRHTSEAIAYLEEVWSSYSPEFPIEYGFVHDAFKDFYQEQETQLMVFLFFALLSIFIAALGLYGMAAFTVNRKRREVSIRKIHGAGLEAIYLLLSMNMLKLVGIAMLIATPLAWLGVDSWLQRFPYTIGLDWWVFAIAGLCSLLISQLTITGQVYRVARINPADALRYE